MLVSLSEPWKFDHSEDSGLKRLVSERKGLHEGPVEDQ